MFAARQWRCFYMHFQPASEPCKYGWRLKNNKYQIEWFQGQVCARVMDILDIGEADLGKLSTYLLL